MIGILSTVEWDDVSVWHIVDQQLILHDYANKNSNGLQHSRLVTQIVEHRTHQRAQLKLNAHTVHVHTYLQYWRYLTWSTTQITTGQHSYEAARQSLSTPSTSLALLHITLMYKGAFLTCCMEGMARVPEACVPISPLYQMIGDTSEKIFMHKMTRLGLASYLYPSKEHSTRTACSAHLL